MGVVPKHARGRHGQNPRATRSAKRRDLEPTDHASLKRKEQAELRTLNELYGQLERCTTLIDNTEYSARDRQSAAIQSANKLQKICRKQLRKVCAHTEISFDRAMIKLPLLERVFVTSANWQPKELRQQSKSSMHETDISWETVPIFPDLPVPKPQQKLEPSSVSVARPGQTEFRAAILNLYGQCAVTGCSLKETIDAAHIVPYVDERSHVLNNGLALRADIHRLYDAGLLLVTANYQVLVSDILPQEYAAFHGRMIHLPSESEYFPDKMCLEFHAQMFL